jgi:ABC-type phosphate/phosphonate transport system substrate-binding protein
MSTLTKTDTARHGLSRREALALLAASPLTARALGQDTGPAVTVAISSSLVGEVSLNDARAAMAVWLGRLTREMELDARWNPEVFEDARTFGSRLRAGALDAVVVSITEYRPLAPLLDDSVIAVPVMKGKLHYVLLTRSGAGIGSLADLKGRSLILHDSPFTRVAPAWLATLVHAIEPGGLKRYFGAITSEARPAKAMLPLFFGQADACVTTSETFTTMAELNPQMGKRLAVLATSPEIVPSVYAFRKGWDHRLRSRMWKAMEDMGRSQSGKQVLTLFQIERLEGKDRSHLQGTLSILSQAARAGFDFSSQTAGGPGQ